jgi:simple sugar transport system permease protein
MALGAINAVFISVLNLPTLITTLGTLSLFHGALLEFVGTKSINTGGLPNCFKTFSSLNILSFTRADGTTYGLSVFVLFFIAVVLISWVILRFSVLGRGIYAIGGNFTAAKRSGLNIHRYSNPNYIVGTELSVIAAVVIGGARITGGTGSIIGTILGVVMIVILEKNLVLIGLSSYWQQFFIGLIIIVGVSVTYIQNRIRSGRSALTAAGT